MERCVFGRIKSADGTETFVLIIEKREKIIGETAQQSITGKGREDILRPPEEGEQRRKRRKSEEQESKGIDDQRRSDEEIRGLSLEKQREKNNKGEDQAIKVCAKKVEHTASEIIFLSGGENLREILVFLKGGRP